jgi:cell wall-associated NlpC family hydrolase
MIKENILNFTAVLSLFVLTGSAADADFSKMPAKLKTVYVTELVQPTSPEKTTQLDELDKIILQYEGQRKVREVEVELEVEKQRTIQMAEWAASNLFVTRQAKIDDLIKSLLSQVGVTEYGFGDTPELWDCSGLTKWYLAQQDIDVVHSATAQVKSGTRVQSPIAGDLVGFKKLDSDEYFHIGVYVGGGLMVHASNPEKDTNLQSIYEFATVEDSEIVFVRY